MKAFLLFVLRICVWGAMVVFGLGLIVRFTIRDSVERLGVIYYATPWLVLTSLAIFCCTYWLWRKRRKTGLVFAVLVLLCGGFWLQKKIYLHPEPAASKTTLRFMYWNVARPGWRLKGVLDVTGTINADVMAFGESRNKVGVTDPRWAESLAPKKLRPLRQSMLLAAQQDIAVVESGSLNGRGDYDVSKIQHDGKEVYVMIVDFSPSPTRTRRPPFEKLYTLIEKYEGKRLLIAGDFNTPSDSVYFDPIRAKLKNAFESGGRGNADTWPSLLPVLAIDQVWLSQGLRAVACKNRSSIYSDHCMVVTDIVVE